MAFIRTFSDALKTVWKNKRLWLLHFFLNAAIFAGAVLWLKILDASFLWLVFGFIVARVVVGAALWLHAGTFAYFLGAHGSGDTSLAAGFRTGRRHIIAFAIWSIIFALLVCAVLYVSGLATDTGAFASWLRSIMPAFLRRMISLNAVDSTLNWTSNLLLYVVVPALVLPFAVQFAGRGLAAFGSSFKAWRQTVGRFSYWFWFCVLVVVGIYLPNLIAHWVPSSSSIPLETLSMIVRLALAFALTVTAWLILSSMLGRLGGGGESPSGDAPA